MHMVAAGHLTEVPVKSMYSDVISLRGIRLMIFPVILNQMEAWGTDISSAYLEAFTKEKLFVKAGPEFGDQEGHILLVKKALYGLQTSGVRRHERIADCLRGMAFCPCKAEPDIWMREKTDHWEYISSYVDDLAITSKDPQAIVDKTDEPDFSALPDITYNWAQSVYGNVKEVIPEDCLKPLGKHVTLSHYVNANLYHDMLSGRSFTGILHFVNKCPIDWYSKKQGTVETATYGSEANAARTATEQIIKWHGTLRCMGVPLRDSSYMFGDNKTVIDSGLLPHAKLHKRHTMILQSCS